MYQRGLKGNFRKHMALFFFFFSASSITINQSFCEFRQLLCHCDILPNGDLVAMDVMLAYWSYGKHVFVLAVLEDKRGCETDFIPPFLVSWTFTTADTGGHLVRAWRNICDVYVSEFKEMYLLKCFSKFLIVLMRQSSLCEKWDQERGNSGVFVIALRVEDVAKSWKWAFGNLQQQRERKHTVAIARLPLRPRWGT